MKRDAGIVLCGGHSQRMGQPKAWLPFGDELLLQRVVRILSQAVSPVVVVGARGQSLPVLPADVIFTSDLEPDQGPLQGLASGLAITQSMADRVFLCACDQPFLTPEWVRFVMDQCGDHPACVPQIAGHWHPLSACYRCDLLPQIHDLLRTQASHGLRHLLSTISPRILQEADLAEFQTSFSAVQNLNTPEEYRLALQQAFGVSSSS